MSKRLKTKPSSRTLTNINRKDSKLTFSFQYYDVNSDGKYCISRFDELQIKEAMARLKEISSKTLSEILSQRSYHAHAVSWEKTTEKNGFGSSHVGEMYPFQFALPNVNQSMCRVFGAISGSVFYVVWFDLNHEIWPTKLKNT